MSSDVGLSVDDADDQLEGLANISTDQAEAVAQYLTTFSTAVCELISEASELISCSGDYPDEHLADLIDDVERLTAAMIAKLGDGE